MRRSTRTAGIALLALTVLFAALLAAPALARIAGPRAVAAANKAPAVSKQPVSVTVEEGQPATFESAASGSPTPTVQWQRSTDGGTTWSAIEGATSGQFVIASATTSESGNEFRAVWKNVAGEATSKAATLTVRVAPVITLQPVEATVQEGQNAVFEAAASGFPAPTVQWQQSVNGGSTWTSVSGATSDVLTLSAVKLTQSGHQYRALFTNTAGKATSNAATLTVQKAPAVTKQPASITVDQGEAASFEATASGTPAPTVQWEVSTDGGTTFAPIEGATATRYTIAAAKDAEDGDQFRAVFTNAAGKATTTTATLTVHQPPEITLEPHSTTVEVGEAATFEAEAAGYPTPTVQWESSTDSGATWSPVSGATSDQLAIPSAQLSENGHEFRAVFANLAGRATSNAAILTVATSHYSALSWGDNRYRQLGNGTAQALSNVPVKVSNLKFVTGISAGLRHTLALVANGTVWAWGYNAYGQLGDGSTNFSAVPVQVEGLSNVVQVAAGGFHSLALLSNGTVMAWGSDEYGQLGNGKISAELEPGSEVPVPVKGLSGVKAIAAGENFSLALLTNGTVMAWGDGLEGQLGNGAAATKAVPVAVKGLTGVSAISAGANFALAVSKGAVEGWGSDQYGELDNSTVEEAQTDVPVPVGSFTNVRSVAAGKTHALALLENGTVMAWGENADGELGNGTTKAIQETPVEVSGLSGVSAISAGHQDSMALLNSGAIMAWGANNYGQLGDGVTGGISSTPVQVAAIAKAASISAGGTHMVAYGEALPAITSVSPSLGAATGGTEVTIDGVELQGATSVKFGAAEATSFTVNSPTSITAFAPAGTGTVEVVVSTPNGTTTKTSAAKFTYQQLPTVKKIAPKNGSTLGGTTVTITGTEFTGASAVMFGSTPASSYTVVSSTTIQALTPPLPLGVANVTVTNSDGTSAIVTADRFSALPTIESVTPNAGPVAGGTSVTVTGTGFAPGASVFKFGTVKATAVSCESTTTCTMLSPAHAAGTVDVTATVSKTTSAKTAADKFTYS